MPLDLPISNDKQPSKELLKLIDDLKINLVKAKDLFVRIVNKARDEGFEDKEIDVLLYSKLKEIIPRKTLYRYRQEFIPLAINKQPDNINLEQSSIISGSDDTIVDDDHLEEEWNQNKKKEYQEYLEIKQKTEKIKKQLPEDVVKNTEQVELSVSKLAMLIHPRLKKQPKLQEALVYKIKDLSPQKARDIVHQTIHNLETGYVKEDEGNYTVYDIDKKENIKENIKIGKQPVDYYFDIIRGFHKILLILTGHELTERELHYTKEIIEYTENHRFKILKSLDSDVRQLNTLYLDYLKPAKLVIDDMMKKIEDELEISKQKQDMMKE